MVEALKIKFFEREKKAVLLRLQACDCRISNNMETQLCPNLLSEIAIKEIDTNQDQSPKNLNKVLVSNIRKFRL